MPSHAKTERQYPVVTTIKSEKPETGFRDIHGPVDKWRPDLPGDEGQPPCASAACIRELAGRSRTIKPGMYYKIRGIKMIHVTCPNPETF